ncbi:hypothetical protein RYX36_004307 [Vicia faba]
MFATRRALEKHRVQIRTHLSKKGPTNMGYGAQSAEEKKRLKKLMINLDFNGEFEDCVTIIDNTYLKKEGLKAGTKKQKYDRISEKNMTTSIEALKKEEKLNEAFRKIEPTESSETTDDPKILTLEKHFFSLNNGSEKQKLCASW